MYYHQLSWRLPHSLALVLFVSGISGCQSIDTNVANLLGAAPPQPSAHAAAPDPNAPTYFVELRADKKKPVVAAVPLNDVTYVQQAIDQSGAMKKFRRVKIEVYRHLPNGGGHKIPVHYDRGKRRVDPGTDYSIHPQDRIVITEDTSTILDDMLETLGSGGFGL